MANWQPPKRNHTPILISFVLTRGTGRKWSSSKEALYLGKSKQDIKAIDSYFDAYPRSRCLKSKHVRVLNSSQSPIRPVFKVYFKLWVQIKPWVLCDHTENRNGGCGKNFSTAEQVGARSFFLLPRSALPWDSPTCCTPPETTMIFLWTEGSGNKFSSEKLLCLVRLEVF